MPDDLIISSSVSIEALKKVFETAAYTTSLDDKGNLWIHEAHKIVIQIHPSKRYLLIITPFSPRPEATAESRLAFVNDWNKKSFFPRAVDVGPYIAFDFLVWLDGGLTPKNLVIAFRTYLDGFRAGSSRDNVIMAKIFNVPKVENNLYGRGTGGSFETAVVINANDNLEGVRAEYAYVAGECGERGRDWDLAIQRLDMHNGKPHDVLTIKLSSGQARVFYFDVSKCFGK